MSDLTYDEWLELNQDEIDIELAENGADREMDFDCDNEYEHRYLQYLSDNDPISKDEWDYHEFLQKQIKWCERILNKI
tara:strand:+ start:2167 stop:2400 length:234 start_codon:yes stop_codon:yes gene_type:complete